VDPANLVTQTLSAPVTVTSGSGPNALTSVVRTSGAINPVDYAASPTPKQGWKLLLAVNAADSAPSSPGTQNAERVLGDGGLISSSRYHFATSNPDFNNGSTTVDGVTGANAPRH